MTRSLFRMLGVLVVIAVAMTLTGLPHPLESVPRNIAPSRNIAIDPRLQQMRAQGDAYKHAGLWPQMAESSQRGAEMALAQGDLIYAVKFLNNLGGAELAMFDHKAAIEAFLQAKAIAEKQRDGHVIGATALNLASLYLQEHNWPAAEYVAGQGLTAAGNSDPYGLRAFTLITLGHLRWQQERKPEAIAYMTQAIDVARATGHQNLVAQAWDSLGELQFTYRDLPRAEGPLEEGFRLRLLFHDPSLGSSYINLSQLRLAQGDPESASNLLNRASSRIDIAANVPVWKIEWLRGKIFEKQNKPVNALDHFEKAVKAFEDSGEKFAPVDAHRTSIVSDERVTALFTSRIETSLAQNPEPNVDAFIAAEEYRSVSLQQTFTQSSNWRKRVPAQYWQVLSKLRSAQTAELVAKISNPAVRELEQSLAEYEVRAGLPQTRTSSNKTNEKYGDSTSLRDIQGTLAPTEALFSFYLGKNVSVLWAVTDEGIEFHKLGSQEVLSKQARDFRQAVEHDAPARDGKGEELYNGLFRDFSPRIQRKPVWLITATDEIFDIPMASLVIARNEGKPMYLVEKHATERQPSALVLGRRPLLRSDGPFLGVADGIYNVADARWKPVASERLVFGLSLPGRKIQPGFEMGRLAGSAEEIKACARIWEGARPPVLLTGSQASRERFETELRNRPAVIHLATHVIAAKNPKYAVINFGLSPLGQPDVLTYSDIANLAVEGATVVVNGCASSDARAKFGKGDDMGLPRAWLIAGAQQVVGSQWAITNDSGELFHSFYLNWKNGRDGAPRKRIVAESLRHAQLEAIHGNTWRSNPKYWGAFYVFGKE